MSRSSKKNFFSEKGFSLIEIIIALSILAISFFSLIEVFPKGISMNASSRSKTVASYLAQDKIERLFAQGYDNVATGTIEAKHKLSTEPGSYLSNYKRRTHVDYIDGNLTATSGDSGMKRISTTVYYTGGVDKKEKSFRVNTIISKN